MRKYKLQRMVIRWRVDGGRRVAGGKNKILCYGRAASVQQKTLSLLNSLTVLQVSDVGTQN